MRCAALAMAVGCAAAGDDTGPAAGEASVVSAVEWGEAVVDCLPPSVTIEPGDVWLIQAWYCSSGGPCDVVNPQQTTEPGQWSIYCDDIGKGTDIVRWRWITQP